MLTNMSNAARSTVMTTAGGRITCTQCQARSKRTGDQCRAPAMRAMRVCRFHGGKSTGPRTKAGLARCAAAKTIHGEETNAKQKAHRAFMKRFKELERLAKQLGLFGSPRRWQ
jgi:hypothetical protein